MRPRAGFSLSCALLAIAVPPTSRAGLGEIAILAVCSEVSVVVATAVPVPLTPSHGGPLAAVPCRMTGSTVLVPVQINRGGPNWFILDSGAGFCVVDSGLARQIGLAASGTGRASGAGSGTVPYDRLDSAGVALSVGGQTLRLTRGIALNLSNQKGVLGETVDGILGFDFFNRFVVEIDYENAIVRLYDPSSYLAPPQAREIPLTFDRHVPHVRARLTIAGGTTRTRALLVDTGSQDAVDDSLVLESRGPRATVVGGVGIGQEYSVVLARFERIELGGFVLEGLTGVAPGVALIGGEVLSRFRVTFDYPHARMFLEPNRHLHDAPAEDASGLDLRLSVDGRSLEVHDVQHGSAAADAGVAGGDQITALDGIGIAELGLVRAQRLLMADGHSIELAMQRGGRAITATLRLRRWLPMW